MNDTTIKQNFRRIGDIGKNLERLVILIVVVMRESLNPGLDFLTQNASQPAAYGASACIAGNTPVSATLLRALLGYSTFISPRLVGC